MGAAVGSKPSTGGSGPLYTCASDASDGLSMISARVLFGAPSMISESLCIATILHSTPTPSPTSSPSAAEGSSVMVNAPSLVMPGGASTGKVHVKPR